MGINGKENKTAAELQQRLTDTLREIAGLQWGGNAWPLTTAEQRAADRMCRRMVSMLMDEFDIFPKGELQQEWGVQITEGGKTVIETHPGMGEPLTREAAFYENERWKSFGYNTEGVMFRQVSEWKRADQ